MTIADKKTEFGYWPAKRMNGEIPQAIRYPHEYEGSDVLNIACTQTTLSKSQQEKLVNEWCACLPDLPAKTLVFSSKVPQHLFDAACHMPQLEALFVKWSSLANITAIADLARLRAFYLGGAPSVDCLAPLAKLDSLEYLFIENVKDPVDILFLESLATLKEFGLSAARGKKIGVASLNPLSGLSNLAMLWLVSVDIKNGDLQPLYGLKNLRSFRSTIKPTSQEFKALCMALPELKFFQPVG